MRSDGRRWRRRRYFPMSFSPLPRIGIPTAVDPVCARLRLLRPGTGHPDPAVLDPGIVAGYPDIAGTRGHLNAFNDTRWRSLPNHDRDGDPDPQADCNMRARTG